MLSINPKKKQKASNFPTNIPSLQPTMVPTSNPDKLLVQQRRGWEQIGYYFVYVCGGVALIGILIANVFHRNKNKGGADFANFSAILRFFATIADFGSDVLLTIVFFIIQKEKGGIYFYFFIASLTFTALPHLVSCFVGIYFIEKWRNKMDSYMFPYLKKYDVFLIVMTIFAGFFSSVELARSRLFYSPMFGLYVKKSDTIPLKNGRFITEVVLEV